MDARNVLATLEAELAREKAKTRRMARKLRAKKRAAKELRKNMRRIQRVNEQRFLVINRRMENMVDDFLVAADAENNDPSTVTIWTEIAMREIIGGLNDLNLTVNQI
ncbi:hypothetical protein PTKIN_Ptkin01aG0303800 [Pterospermum kingtungense]